MSNENLDHPFADIPSDADSLASDVDTEDDDIVVEYELDSADDSVDTRDDDNMVVEHELDSAVDLVDTQNVDVVEYELDSEDDIISLEEHVSNAESDSEEPENSKIPLAARIHEHGMYRTV